MRNKKFVSLIIPTLNEAKNLPKILKNIPSYVDETIIIDGHSNDNTVKIARTFGCKILFDKEGKGSALIKGAKHAKGDYIVMMDADWSHRIEEMCLLITGLELGYDVSMGSRFMQGGGTDDMTAHRVLGNKFFVTLVNILFGMKYTDMCYGYRAFRKEAFNKLRLESKGFAIETEISIQAAKKNLKVLEVPSFEKKRNHGEGKLRSLSDGFKILKIIIKELIRK